MRIADYLTYGQENAVPLRELVKLTGLDSRELRRLIAAERRAGEPILSGQRGYFLSENTEEKRQFVRSMRNRAKEIMDAADAVEKISDFI